MIVTWQVTVTFVDRGNAGSWWNFRTAGRCVLATTVGPAGAGSVNVNLAPNCAGGKYQSGTVLQLNAAASAGYGFTARFDNAHC